MGLGTIWPCLSTFQGEGWKRSFGSSQFWFLWIGKLCLQCYKRRMAFRPNQKWNWLCELCTRFWPFVPDWRSGQKWLRKIVLKLGLHPVCQRQNSFLKLNMIKITLIIIYKYEKYRIEKSFFRTNQCIFSLYIQFPHCLEAGYLSCCFQNTKESNTRRKGCHH